MNKTNTRRLVIVSLSAALTCAATLAVRIPSPTGGYINPGDAMVLFSAFAIGGLPGAAAAGVGSALADLFSGYIIYAPATLIIKSLMALTAWYVYKTLTGKAPATAARNIMSLVAAGVAAEIIMVAGYFFFASVILGLGSGALAEIPGNIVQGAFGVIAGTALRLALGKRISV